MNDFSKLYNKILLKSRNFDFFNICKIEDNIENKIIIFLFFLAIFFNKVKNFDKKKNQLIFDFVFLRVETDLREVGFGDAYINKKMKNVINKFYSILIEFNNFIHIPQKNKTKLLQKFFKTTKYRDLNYVILIKSLDKFAITIDLISINDIYCANF